MSRLCAIRNLDCLGRITIPKSIRIMLNMEVGQHLSMYMNKDRSITINLSEKNKYTRKLDKLGRVVINSAFRNELGIKQLDAIEIYVEENSIILKKKDITCSICGSYKGLIEFKEKYICRGCIKDLKNI